ELYCPGTPVGDIALNDAETVANFSPATPAVGSTFNMTGYQTSVNIPAALVTAAAALGNADLTGTAGTQLDAFGATPATLAAGPFNFDAPLNQTNADGSITLNIPAPAASVGPFTATNAGITIEEDSSASLTLIVSGNPLTLTCTAFPNNSVAEGFQNPPDEPSNSISPVIAVLNGGTTPPTTTTMPGGGGTTTTKPGGGGTTTTANPVVAANAGSLAFTGTGSGTKLMALLGALLVLFGLILLGVVDAPRRMLRSLAVLNASEIRGKVADRVSKLHPPKIHLPKINAPKFHMPKVNLPRVHQPTVTPPVAVPPVVVPPVVAPPTMAPPAAPLPQTHAFEGVAPPQAYPAPRVQGSVATPKEAGGHLASNTARSARRGARWLLGR
ncbi:MAG TPA: hypothetical protein VKR22_09760, partial [Acidimicrobiales bacterium]|nr:hypothetical protein [Acidimicrobiales bacterium]